MIRQLSLLLLLAAWPVAACNIPVFRYALERWPADRYQIRVALPRDSNESQRAAVDVLRQAVDTNLTVLPPDEGEAGMALLAPITGEPVWRGELSVENARRLVDSPARRELVRRLLAGDSVVWVLIESGDASLDEAAAIRLQADLDWVQAHRSLPVLADDETVDDGVPLKLAMSLLRVSRRTPEETVFVACLEHLEADLPSLAGEPIAIPVFGRGRALYGLVGKGIVRANVDEACTYLIGACSCLVKDQNPGKDLLLAADWEAPFTAPVTPVPGPELVGLALPEPMTPAVSPTAQSAPVAMAVPGVWRSLLLLFAVVIAGIVAVTVAIFRRTRPPDPESFRHNRAGSD